MTYIEKRLEEFDEKFEYLHIHDVLSRTTYNEIRDSFATSIHQALAEERERVEIEEMPQFEGTLEALNKLTIIK